MKTEDGGKVFDCVKWTRRIRDQIHEETAGMSRRGAAGSGIRDVGRRIRFWRGCSIDGSRRRVESQRSRRGGGWVVGGMIGRGKEGSMHLSGQEINAETYAICKADLVGGDSDWPAMWEGHGPVGDRPAGRAGKRSGHDVKLRVYIDTFGDRGVRGRRVFGAFAAADRAAERWGGDVGGVRGRRHGSWNARPTRFRMCLQSSATSPRWRRPRAARSAASRTATFRAVPSPKSRAMTRSTSPPRQWPGWACWRAGTFPTHVVNFRRIKRYNDVNREAGYAPLDIRSPRELENEE